MWSGYTPETGRVVRDLKKTTAAPLSYCFTPFALAQGLPAVHAPGQMEQYAYKAAFLYRFTDYIEWENMDRTRTFNIAVLGNSPITMQMTTLAGEERVKNKIMRVKEYETLDELGLPHILFVSSGSMVPVKAIIAKYSGKPVLIVTEIAERGEGGEKGYINFFISDNKLKFEIRLKSVNNAGIRISSQLLQHAIITDT